VNIAEDGKKATIDIKVFENGVYLVDVYARSNQESTVILKERYKVIHEGNTLIVKYFMTLKHTTLRSYL